MSSSRDPSPRRILALLGLMAVAGVPMVAYLWETLHQALALRVDPARLLISLPLLAALAGLLAFVGRRLGG